MPDVPFQIRDLRVDPSQFSFCEAPTVVENLTGDLIAAWGAGADERMGKTAILTARLARGLRNWTPARVVVDTPEHRDLHPVLFRDTFGTLSLFFTTLVGEGEETGVVRAVTSCEGGNSWDLPVPMQETPGWMTRTKPSALRNGDVVMPVTDGRDGHPFLLATSDCAHWEIRGDLRPEAGPTHPTLCPLEDGSLLAYLSAVEGRADGRLLRTTSRDGGRSWSRPEAAPIPNPGTPAELLRLRNGHLVLAFNNSPRNRSPLALGLSLDQGRTWRYVRDLEAGSGDFSAPAMIQSEDGAIQVLYAVDRRLVRHVTLTEAWIREGGTPLAG